MSVRIVVTSPEGPSPFAPQAVVLEDDTYRVLGAEPVASERYEDTGRALERAAAAEPELPGSVIVSEKSPLVFHAVVHDLDSEPSWREEWVVDAIYRILREAGRRKLRCIALPMLGTLHGSLDARRFVQLLRSALVGSDLGTLEAIWLLAPAGTPHGVFDPLREQELEIRC